MSQCRCSQLSVPRLTRVRSLFWARPFGRFSFLTSLAGMLVDSSEVLVTTSQLDKLCRKLRGSDRVASPMRYLVPMPILTNHTNYITKLELKRFRVD